jgi:ribonuclease BN (tRNA processing enzyme)
VEIRLLGSGGWLSTDRRLTACVYLRDGADVLVLDAGSGFARLVSEPALLDGVERLSVVLTHFHLDHTNGLVALPGLARVPVREVWAPGPVVAGVPSRELLERLLGPPFLLPTVDAGSTLTTAIHELGEDLTIGPFRLRLRVQPLHVCPTIGIRVGDDLAYCTDTAYDEATAEFARGARVLLHEAFYASPTTDDRTHTAAGEAGRLAAAAGVERLVLAHVHPLQADDDELARFARAEFAASETGRDGATL